MEMTPEQASRLAEEAHAGQVDRAGQPYTEHVFAVRDLLAVHGDRARMAGVLHDVLEDTPLTSADLRARGCPEEVVRAVESVTRRRGEPYEDLVRRAAADPLGRLVKLADNAHNSDEERLAVLPAEQAARLRAKYARAREVLEGRQPREETAPRAALLVVYTGRVEECRAFYTELGLRFVLERHGRGPEHHAAELAGGAVFEIYPAAPGRRTGAAQFGFAVDSRHTWPPLEPGHHTLTDPDGRKVDLRVV